jgi:hypothetical protein
MIRLLPLLALLWTGCSRHEAPADAVKRYYKAMAANDCATLTSLLADEHADCKAMHEDYVDNGVAFVGIQKVEPDGRDPKVTLVSASVRYKKSDHVWIIRAEDHGGRWKLRF